MSSTSSITTSPHWRAYPKPLSPAFFQAPHQRRQHRERVRDAAEQLNYQANSAASALRSDTTNTIGSSCPARPTLWQPDCSRSWSPKSTARDASCCWASATTSNPDGTHRSHARPPGRRLVVMPPQDANTAAFLDGYVGMTSLVQAFGHSTSFHVNWVGVDESAP